jgi:hypothetical protein
MGTVKSSGDENIIGLSALERILIPHRLDRTSIRNIKIHISKYYRVWPKKLFVEHEELKSTKKLKSALNAESGKLQPPIFHGTKTWGTENAH